MDGYGLVVIFSNPGLPLTTVAVLDGGAEQAGDTTIFNFASPLDKTVTGFSAIMSLGIGSSYQGGAINSAGTNACRGGVQVSTVDVNGQRLTSCAGNYDDGFANNGAPFTVGGVGDSTNNPAAPLTRKGLDDELYNLEPFLSQNDTQLVIDTANPSGDDIVFVAVIAITARAAVTTEICDDGIDNDGDGLIDGDDPDCQVEPPPPPQQDERRMTGGGKIGNTKVSHGFTIQCDLNSDKPNNIQVNWGKGNKFHLEGKTLTSAVCSDDPNIDEENPVAGFDTFVGSGTGRYNKESGATIEFTFTDAEEPGKNDNASIKITDASNNVVLDVSGNLNGGNHQAHTD